VVCAIAFESLPPMLVVLEFGLTRAVAEEPAAEILSGSLAIDVPWGKYIHILGKPIVYMTDP
jgi:hypothetical protein